MADTTEAKRVLQQQAAALGLEVDKRWSVETLADKVREAQEAQSEAKRNAYAASDKVDVFLLRDAFPVEDEKHEAGTVVSVPEEMARYWYVNGVARPA